MRKRYGITTWIAILACIGAAIKTGTSIASFQNSYPQQVLLGYPGDIMISPADDASEPIAATLLDELRQDTSVAISVVETIDAFEFNGQSFGMLGTQLQQPMRSFDFIVPPDKNSRYYSGDKLIEPVYVEKQFALKQNVFPGEVFTTRINGENRRKVVAAVFESNLDLYDIVMERSTMNVWLKADRADQVLVELKDRRDIDKVINRISEAHPAVQITNINELRERLLTSASNWAAIGYLAIIIGVCGIITVILMLGRLPPRKKQ